MSTNIQKLAARLKELEDGQKSSEFSKVLWKPKEGAPQKIRIVPYQFNPESPFIELQFYYNIQGKHYLAPSTFGKPDPIQELIEALRASGSNEEKELAKKISPTKRTYVPIIVRGEEELGVRYWGFGTTVYKQLLTLMTNADWGDITSYTEGNDLTVEFKPSAKKNVKTGQSFPETTITPSPKKTMVVDPSRKDLMEKIKNQVDILKIFPLKTYEELKQVVQNWLHPNESSDSDPNETEQPVETADETETNEPKVESATASVSTSSSKLAEEFDAFFKK